MRFLFVYETHAVQAKNLLAELLVSDVRIIVARKGELGPRDSELQLLEQHRGAEAAACELNRKYRKNVQPYVNFTVEPKKFRFEDQLLRQWLLGSADLSADAPPPLPTTSFGLVAAAAPALRLHQKALSDADDLDGSRWAFAAKAAALLGQMAAGVELGPPHHWEAEHGVAFAANGQVAYKYTVEVEGKRYQGSSEWHLKAGDKTTADRAARIYFTTATVSGTALVLVAYVGPHPKNGIYDASFAAVDVDESGAPTG